MDILTILEESKNELYPDDLDFFETELMIGKYSDVYVIKCRRLIKEIRAELIKQNTYVGSASAKKSKANPVQKIKIKVEDLAPIDNNPTASAMTIDDVILREIKELRKEKRYKSLFKEYLKKTKEINGEFVDKYFSFFEKWEIDAIITTVQLGDEVLEKHFGALSRKNISKYQAFSEEFFMKHFFQLDFDIVLKEGVNEWRQKENRSKQLEMFLRLKGYTD